MKRETQIRQELPRNRYGVDARALLLWAALVWMTALSSTSPVSAAAAAPTMRPAQQAGALQEVLPGLWVGGAVAVEQMPGWPVANTSASATAAPAATAENAVPTAAPSTARLFAVIDLRQPGEGASVAAEREAARAAGVGYLSIPVGAGPPPRSAVAQLEAVLRNAEGAPVVLHCVSGVRAADLLARYLIHTGVDVDTAIARARAVGLGNQRAEVIRSDVLGHP